MEFNKDLIAASSTPIVLAILTEGDSYGYAIIKRVQELSGGRIEWTDGMLYPVLHRLERLGYIKARWEESETGRRRKYYRITAKGKGQLEEERKQWQAVDATLRGLWQRGGLRPGSRSAPLMSATRLGSAFILFMKDLHYEAQVGYRRRISVRYGRVSAPVQMAGA